MIVARAAQPSAAPKWPAMRGHLAAPPEILRLHDQLDHHDRREQLRHCSAVKCRRQSLVAAIERSVNGVADLKLPGRNIDARIHADAAHRGFQPAPHRRTADASPPAPNVISGGIVRQPCNAINCLRNDAGICFIPAVVAPASRCSGLSGADDSRQWASGVNFGNRQVSDRRQQTARPARSLIFRRFRYRDDAAQFAGDASIRSEQPPLAASSGGNRSSCRHALPHWRLPAQSHINSARSAMPHYEVVSTDQWWPNRPIASNSTAHRRPPRRIDGTMNL